MNNSFTKLALVAVVAMAGASFVAADEWNKKTTITTDEVLQLPNATLQPGTYVMKLMDSQSDRHIVQIFDKDQKHLITTILAIPNQRLQPTGKTVFSFWETPAGQPKALRAWFYPGDNFGQEFLYPKNEAALITANNSGATVAISDEKPADLAASVPVEKESSATATVATAEPVPAPAAVVTPEPVRVPEPARVEVAAAPQQSAAPAPIETPAPAVRSTDDAQTVASSAAASDSLPKTASNLPLLGLLGLLSTVGAMALSLRLRRN